MRVSNQQLVGVGAGSGPLYVQIYQQLRRLILDGAWSEGARIPSSRSIAHDLGVSRNTALLAIDKLMADGWIVARPGSGIYVSAETPPARPQNAPEASARDKERSPVPVPFEIAHAATDIFPIPVWSKIQSKVWAASPEDALHEGAGAGWLPLRQEIASYLYALRGLPCSADQILIVSSSQAAMDLALRVLAQPGDGIWVEDPGYPQARQAFQSHQLRQHKLPVDGEGVDVTVGRESAPNAKFAYVTPACQFPMCAILSADRRRQLLSWARDQGAYIIEDDWDFNATFNGQFPVEPLAAQDNERVIFVHAFNRLMFPALRLCALVVPVKLAERFQQARLAIDGFPNVPNQIALAEFMRQGLLSAHLRRCRTAYDERRACLHGLIREYLSDWVEVDADRAGLHALARSLVASDSALAARARRHGIACLGVNDFKVEPATDKGALILGFGAFSPTTLRKAVQELATVFRQPL